jgi:phospholipase/lecithinase/hemolysin
MLRHLQSLVLRCLFVVTLSFATGSWAGQANYNVMYVFGDSLSDTGNDFVASSAQGLSPAIPPSVTPYATYWKGRFTNGPVAVEYLWDLMQKKPGSELAPSLTTSPLAKKTGISYAFGGSTSGVYTPTPLGLTVPGLLGQVQLFHTALGARRAPTNALYVVWSGANDYLQRWTSDPSVVVGNVVQSVRQLHALGARSFLIPNLPDMGLTPLVQAQGAGSVFTQLSRDHNAVLAAALASLATEIPSLRLVTVDVFGLSESLVASGQVSTTVPALEFLAPGSGAADCLLRNPATCIDVNLSAFLPPHLFWDALHPTTQIHGLIGTAMHSALLRQP